MSSPSQNPRHFTALAKCLGSIIAGLAILSAAPAQAATQLISVSPGAIDATGVKQVVLKFSAGVIAFGDPQAQAPASLVCRGPNAGKVGIATQRWQSDRLYSFDFNRALPGGVACTIQMRDGFKDTAGQAVEIPAALKPLFSFKTEGPGLQLSEPRGGRIEEEQYFLATTDLPVDRASIERHAYCVAKGIGERIAVQVVESKGPTEWTLRCQRPLPNTAEVQLVWGRGIPALGSADFTRRTDQRFQFEVRPKFEASFSCERVQAQAPCLPITPMQVMFTESIPATLAAKVELVPVNSSSAASTAPRAIPPTTPSVRKPRLAEKQEWIDSLEFLGPFPENTEYQLRLPPDLLDQSGRKLANLGLFPMRIRTGGFPPLVKFASAPFAVVERIGEQGVVPLTVRSVEASSQVRSLHLTTDAQIVAWLARLNEYHETALELPSDGRKKTEEEPRTIETRTLSIFEPFAGTEMAVKDLKAARDKSTLIPLPAPPGNASARPFEVVGLPLKTPGLYVLEASSKLLGQSLLAASQPMYVRTGALVTNLAVHIKRGRESSAVWVTRLDNAKPVANARVNVLSCEGKVLWSGVTGPQGWANIDSSLSEEYCRLLTGVVAIARVAAQGGMEDIGFALSSWQQGIEPWRFGLNTDRYQEGDVSEGYQRLRAHSVMDRMLFRAGETLQMKHMLRAETAKGLKLVDAKQLPTELKMVHQGSDQTITQKLVWRAGRDALTTWNIPKAAKLGVYEVFIGDFKSGSFRVEEFRLPAMQARLIGPPQPQIAQANIPLQMQINYQNGGPAANLEITASSSSNKRPIRFDGYENFRFDVDEGEGEDSEQTRQLVNGMEFKLDTKGAAKFAIDDVFTKLAASARVPQTISIEAQYQDPNGQAETANLNLPWFPAAVVAGLRADRWASAAMRMPLQAVALSPSGKPVAGAAVEMRGTLIKRISTRKRMVGGLYSYENRVEKEDMGTLCSGKTDAQGLYECEALAKKPGEWRVELIVSDDQGRKSYSQITQYVADANDASAGVWFAQENDDRIDLWPEKRRYQPGETAKIQVRMPFRQATAWVAIEREGVIEQRVIELNGVNPTIDVPIASGYAPNVYVSVLAVRGRVTPLSWGSFFQWGWKAPRQWWQARQASTNTPAPTATIDLAKPAFKLGVVALNVTPLAQEIKLTVKPEREVVKIREKVDVVIKAVDSAGKPLPAGSLLTVAVVDQALLDLQPNTSWRVLDAMYQQRPWLVETATAQQQVVGKRHYGAKAVAAGGDGGKAPTRELLDTLLLWNPAVVLNAQGEARVTVPINDVLSRFVVMAVADSEVDRFGSASSSIRVTQDLQILAGLPPVVREGDQWTAGVTLRNTTENPMKVLFEASSVLGKFSQTVDIAAQAAEEVQWPVKVDANLLNTPAGRLEVPWQLNATQQGGAAKDALRFSQVALTALPLQVQQATIMQIKANAPQTLNVAPPASAVPGRGGIRVQYSPSIAASLDAVRTYFERYPFSCIEQQTSRAIGLNDPVLWQAMVNGLSSHQDGDGLLDFFPPFGGRASSGSEVLTAYVLNASHHAARLDERFKLPEDIRASLERALVLWLEGRIKRPIWSRDAQAAAIDPTVRRLLVLEALSVSGKVRPAMIEPIAIEPNAWPTHAVLAWANVLRNTPQLPQASTRLAAAEQTLQARLSYQGTRLSFSNEAGDNWWWLMQHADIDAARLVIYATQSPAGPWRDEVSRLMLGMVGRQQAGQWWTTTGNAMSALAVRHFVKAFESTPVQGQSAAVLLSRADQTTQARAVEWSASQPPLELAWRGGGTVALSHVGAGAPWALVQSLAAVPLTKPRNLGFEIKKELSEEQVKTPGRWARGDRVRVTLTISGLSSATWVAVNDPMPAGARTIGGVEQSNNTRWDLAFVESAFDAQRIYFRASSEGTVTLSYVMQLNNPGEFQLPPTRVEAMYQPEMFGETPNPPIAVRAAAR